MRPIRPGHHLCVCVVRRAACDASSLSPALQHNLAMNRASLQPLGNSRLPSSKPVQLLSLPRL
jgi:hypothetical protein